jgi:exosortase A
LVTASEQSRLPVAVASYVVVCGAVLVCLITFGLLYLNATAGAIRVWISSPTFNHCFLVLPLSFFLIWQRRETIDFSALDPDMRSIFVVLGLSCAWTIASIAGVLEAQQFVVMTIVQATLFGIFGAPLYRSMAAPLLYLYFLVPSGAFLVPVLQSFTAHFTVLGLQILAIPVYSTGAVIDIPAGTFAVAEACAGLRFLIASVAFGVFFSILMYESPWRRALFIGLSIIVPVIANGIRALGLLAAAEWIGSPTAALADHIIYGWIFFSFVLIVLILIGRSFSDRTDAPAEGASAVHRLGAPSRGLTRMIVVGGACFVVAAAVAMAYARLAASGPLVLPNVGPRVLSPWRIDSTAPDWKPSVVSPARIFLQSFVSGTTRIDRFIALYAEQGHANRLVRSENRDAEEKKWTFNSEHDTALKGHGIVFPVRVSTWFRGSERRVVWSFYVVGGRPVAGAERAIWEEVRTFFEPGRCVSAYVAFSAQGMEDGPASAALASLLASTEPLSQYLCSAATTKVRQ